MLLCLGLPENCAVSSHNLDSDQNDHPDAYYFSDEEARAYWKKRGRLDPSLIPEVENSLRKRSSDTETACSAMDYTVHEPNGRFVGRHRFKWMTAECVDPFGGGGLFDVHCEHTVNQFVRPFETFIDADKHRKSCKKEEVCVPAVDTGYNGVEQLGPHLDIKCVPGDSVPKPMAFKSPFWDDVVQCTGDIRVPDATTHRRYIPRQGMTFLLTEQIEHTNGRKYNASKLYIEDRTSRVFKPWRRKEVTKTDIAATTISIYADSQKAVIRFCAELAKGSAHWLILHYGVFQVKNHHGRISRQSDANLTIGDHS